MSFILLRIMAYGGHKCFGENKRVKFHLENGKTPSGPSVGNLKQISGFRGLLNSSDFTLATVAPGRVPSILP